MRRWEGEQVRSRGRDDRHGSGVKAGAASEQGGTRAVRKEAQKRAKRGQKKAKEGKRGAERGQRASVKRAKSDQSVGKKQAKEG